MLRTVLTLAVTLCCASLGAQGPVLFAFYGDSANDRFGSSVSGAGDVDNDGVNDIVVGAPYDDVNGLDSGRARVFSGSTGAALYTFDSSQVQSGFGSRVSAAGDVNADGYDDVVVAAPYHNLADGRDHGKVTVFSGQTGLALLTFYGIRGSQMGRAVSGAGDVNNDGYDDIIAGAPEDDTVDWAAGSITVVSGKDGTILYHFDGAFDRDRLGLSVSGAGDLNADGFDEFMASSSDFHGGAAGKVTVYSGKTGTVFRTILGNASSHAIDYCASVGNVDADSVPDIVVAMRHITPTTSGFARVYSGSSGAVIHDLLEYPGIDAGIGVRGVGDIDGDGRDDLAIWDSQSIYSPTWVGSVTLYSGNSGALLGTFHGKAPGDHFGVCDGVGDLDGDGRDEIVVGAPFGDGTIADTGYAQVLTYRRWSLYSFVGDSAGDRFGSSVSGAGDVNADGHPDLIVGAPYDDNFGSDSGSARVISGQDGSTLYSFYGDATQDYLGSSVGDAGDVDGDGYADLIIGSPENPASTTESGEAYVFSGQTGLLLHSWVGDSAGDRFGYSVSGAGDVDADGFDDLIVGAYADDNNGDLCGSARVFSGRTGAVLYTFFGDAADDVLGFSVSGAGDVDRDGFADLIAGAYGDDNNAAGCGSARVFSGRTGAILYTFDGDSADDYMGICVSGAGDVNHDGFADLIVGAFGDDDNGASSGSARVFSGQDGSTLYTFHGDALGDLFGYSVSGAGDANGDGYADLIVGAVFSNIQGLDTGCARVFCGKTGTALYTFAGDDPHDRLGGAVSGAGDVSGDRFADLIVGAYMDDSNGADSGSAFVFSLDVFGTPPLMRIFGKACMGSNGHLPHIDYRGRLAIGESLDFLLRGALPSTTCALVLAGPTFQDLGNWLPGLAGCMQYASSDYIWAWATTNSYGMASFPAVNIPNNPGLLGWHLNAQWGCLDLAANPFGATTSNGLEMVVGQ